ncbi:MAG: protein kinase [Anaerolineae bacterium]|nr:protein kinase [Gemmatimonadaceae bacterium]
MSGVTMDNESSPTFSVRPESFDRFRSALADRYQIEREAGRGGMATVYLAVDLKHGRHVALKVLHQDYAHAIGAERFLREIGIAARLQHPHIVGVHDSGEAAGLLYYVMPYVEGETLRARLVREKQLPIEEAVQIARDVAKALTYAHLHGIVHRDIKPENILLGGTNASVADFGIAKAIHAAGEVKLTSSGLSAGTPAYMSPEQASGSRDIDGRADVYSLGCVLFEMLAGVPPFHGPNAQVILTRHMTEQPPKVRKFRNSVSPALEKVLVRAMAKVPADRYATAGEFEAVLGAAVGASGEESKRTKWLVAAGVALAVAAAAGFLIRGPVVAPASLTDAVAVLPFEHSGAAVTELDGDNCQVMLHDAIARWKGVNLVNTYQLNDARAQRGNQRLTTDARFAVSRKVGARHAIWGHVREVGDVIEVRAAIYDVSRKREAAREYTVRVKRGLSDASAMFGTLADSLVAGMISGSDEVARGAMETTKSDALRKYLAGHKALSVWDVTKAASEFRSASDLDPEYASAHLWYAQTMSWTSDRPEEWRAAAKRATALRTRLAEREQILADGLLALANAEYPAACVRFRTLIARDSGDFAAWYGLGECNRNDRAVIRAGRPERWHFRGSYQAAVNAYREALERVPATHLAFRDMAPGRLATILFAESNHLRRGATTGRDTLAFAAYPAIDADTLAFFPSPLRQHATLEVPPTSIERALRYTRGILGQIAEEWVSAFPRSAGAHLTRSSVLETSLQTSDALSAVRTARQFASEPGLRVESGLGEVRLLLKLQRFREARAFADSMIAWPVSKQHESDWTAALSILTGRTAQAAEKLRRAAQGYAFGTSSGENLVPPRPLSELALTLDAYAAVGAPAARIRSLADSVARLIPSYYNTSKEQREARDALLVAPMSAALPVLGKEVRAYLRNDAGYLERMQLAYTRGDTGVIRRLLGDVVARREQMGIAPGSVSPDFTYHEAWLLAAMGDSAAAAEHLDRALNGLPTLGTYVVRRVQEAAGLVRAMALRAEIAAARGDITVAKKWAGAVAILWSDADAELKDVVTRMRNIAGVK